MDAIQRFVRTVAAIAWGSFAAWLADKGIDFSDTSRELILAGIVAFVAGLVEFGIAFLQRSFPNVKWVAMFEWLLLIPLRPLFLTFDERESLRKALPYRGVELSTEQQPLDRVRKKLN
jgi:hypothetical protein